MSDAKAYQFDEDPDDEFARVPLADTPVAEPRFRHAMTLLVVLSVPLWAAIITVGVLIARALG